MHKLEQRLFSLQSANALRCDTCRPLLSRIKHLEKKLTQSSIYRREQLQDLCRMKYVIIQIKYNL